MFDVVDTELPGLFELRPQLFEDNRGRLAKIFHADFFNSHGLETGFTEAYSSFSHDCVLRGLHFQSPPHDHAKLVVCLAGSVFDAVLDLRRSSPAYGRHVTFALSGEKGNVLYIPRGLAHGFSVEEGPATMMYMTTTQHSPEADAGIAWDSAGVSWPAGDPVISDRDRGFPRLEDFDSPFVYEDNDS
ncbi:MAG: dTDP-4-dehydrorhamnose 3,5-epimerase family protein [Alphaproteobacteria bacterium]|nr:dTDP-4-dehydrorhamnose 3,5-epimerase family protein [Alphaproteobacteria bacterium]